MGAQLRELAFVDVGIFGIELVRHDDAERRVAEKFEPLVRTDVDAGVFVEVGRMDECLFEQGGVLEGKVKPGLELLPVWQLHTPRQAGPLDPAGPENGCDRLKRSKRAANRQGDRHPARRGT